MEFLGYLDRLHNRRKTQEQLLRLSDLALNKRPRHEELWTKSARYRVEGNPLQKHKQFNIPRLHKRVFVE